jgi:hypothetical protein
MAFFNTSGGLMLFVALMILYALWVMYSLSSSGRTAGKGEAGKPRSHPPGSDVVGKSTFDRRQLRPQAADATETEKGNEKESIFAPHKSAKPSGRIPDEELEEVFSAVPDENPRLDVYYPLDDETDEDFAGEGDGEGDETASPPLLLPTGGASFEALEQAVRTVVHIDRATEQEQAAAAKTLADIRPTDMFEQLIGSAPGREDIVREVMQKHLDARAGKKEEGGKTPSDFDIRQYV